MCVMCYNKQSQSDALTRAAALGVKAPIGSMFNVVTCSKKRTGRS